ncbi:MAG: c-type cytochrome [Sphingobacteriales bacterium JAD_PAG50586_3]|nr:MAG: c-type cytochrome [Sphingobacteriales bacterium JAD_PAG50586_3]
MVGCFFNPTQSGLIIVAILLLVVIAVLSSVLKGLARQNTNINIKNNEGKSKYQTPEIKTSWVRGASVIVFILFSTVSAFAQGAAAVETVQTTQVKPPSIDPFVIIMLLFIILEFSIIIGLIASIKRLFVANGLMADAVLLEEVAVEAKVQKAKKPSFMQKWLTRAVPIEQEEAIVFDHEYDGIRELDNSLPPWWLYGFYISIAFAAVYLLHYHVFDTGNLQAAEYKQELADADATKAELMKKMAEKGEVMVNEENVTTLVDATSIANGKATYDGMCIACHGDKAQGNIGPNLTDEYWIYGGSIKNIFKIITNGTPNGMQSWKSQLSPKNIQEVASYIKSINGSKPAGAKAPQGDLWKEEVVAPVDTASAKADSTVAQKTAGVK